jgi:type 1 glutamine amidotransferase
VARKALITWGGWLGHQPEQVAALFREILEADGMEVEVHASLDCFNDGAYLQGLDLIVPVWTMSKIEKEQVVNVSEAVARGTGIAGCHGGMCDAFRDQPLWQFMTGANWVAHPGGDGVNYRVRMKSTTSALTEGIGDFDVSSEQYYLHVDPAVEVLAVTEFPVTTWYHSPNNKVDMPVAWTKRWGLGRVYYNALGHHADVIDHGPAREMLRRGLIWASHGREAAAKAGERYEDYAAEGKHF